MKVYVLPADAFGCGHYRLIWPAQILQRQGFDVQIMPPNQQSGFEARTEERPSGRDRLLELKVPADADVIVMQRPGHSLQAQMIEVLRQNKIAVVVDMDDDMSAIHPRNTAFQMYRTVTDTPFSWRWAEEACRAATMVTTSTIQLQRVYAKHGRGQVLDNYVPKIYSTYDKVATGCFGWAGTTQSHPDDPQVAGRSVQALRDDGHCFRVVGGDKDVRHCFKLADDVPMTGTVPLNRWTRVIADTFDVGMIPLSATSFNSSKSRLKGIEYSSIGVPWVASPRAEYRRLARESSAGLLAETPKQWHEQLKTLLTDEVRRKELVEAGRAYMADQTYEAQAWRWAETWTRALEMERG